MNVMPVLNDDIDFAADSKTTVRTKGVSIPQGGSRRVELDLYSDADTGGPWTVAFFALDLDSPQAFPQSAPHLRLTLDRHSGQNGEKLYLTIQRATTSALGTVVFIESFLGTGSSEWPIAVF